MIPPTITRGGALLIAALAFASATPTALASSSNDDNTVPRGTLNIDRDMVRAGSHPRLDWQISYPSGIDEVVEIVPPNWIVPKKDVRMKVRVLGVAFQTVSTKSNNGHGNNLDGVDSSNPGKERGGPNGAVDPSGDYDDEKKRKGKSQIIELPIDAYWAKNGTSWQRFFYGTSEAVNPDAVLINERVSKNDIIDFGARDWAGGWLPFHHTRSPDPYMVLF